MKKTVCSMLLCYFCLCMVYPSSPKGMRICVINYTSGNLIITYELRNGKSQECYNYLWRQVINGVFLMIGDKLHNGKLSMQSRQYRNGRFFPAILKLWPIVNWPSESGITIENGSEVLNYFETAGYFEDADMKAGKRYGLNDITGIRVIEYKKNK